MQSTSLSKRQIHVATRARQTFKRANLLRSLPVPRAAETSAAKTSAQHESSQDAAAINTIFPLPLQQRLAHFAHELSMRVKFPGVFIPATPEELEALEQLGKQVADYLIQQTAKNYFRQLLKFLNDNSINPQRFHERTLA